MAFHNARDVWGGGGDRGFYSLFMLFSDIRGLADDSLLDSPRLLAPTDATKY